MTSPSNPNSSVKDLLEQRVEEQVNAALDQSVNNLSDKAVSDITQARYAALNALHNRPATKSVGAQLMQMVMQPFPRVALPVAAAVLIAISLNHSVVDPVPALPLAMVTEDVPTEDLALLEDLEFVTWLAQNEQDALL